MSVDTDRIIEIGFRPVGEWKFFDSALELALSDKTIRGNTLYAFVVGGDVRYIGKTIQPLARRLYGYKNPGPTQTTNIRINALLSESATKNIAVEIYALPDNGLIHYGAFHLNLAAGLEDSLVKVLKPKWNMSGKS